MKHICMFLIKVYQVCIRPCLPSMCRHTPGCSNYAIEAYQLHGFFIGSWLALKRILRCHPWGTYGYDPVPKPK